MLDLQEKITISSFLISLANVPKCLPTDLQDEINKLGQKYKQEGTAPIAQLRKLAEKDFLKEDYWRERVAIQNLYQPREQKYDPNKQKPVPKTLENIAVPVPLEQIENLAIEILIAANSCEAARKNKEKIMQEIERELS